MLSRHLFRIIALNAVIIFFPALTAAATTGQADAHMHGRAIMNIAIEGTQVLIELEIPGMDMVGFEHQARTAGQKKAVKAATAKLSKAELIFTLPEMAACKLVRSEVTSGGDRDDHQGDTKHDTHDEAHDQDHMAFHAGYNLTCASPEALSSIRLNLFANITTLKEIIILAVTPKGQIRARADRQNPLIRF